MADANIRPPVARVIPVKLTKHGHVRRDDYHWLNKRENPEVLAYLEAENAYAEAMMAPTKDLRRALVEEIRGRIKQTDTSVPYRRNGYLDVVSYINRHPTVFGAFLLRQEGAIKIPVSAETSDNIFHWHLS